METIVHFDFEIKATTFSMRRSSCNALISRVAGRDALQNPTRQWTVAAGNNIQPARALLLAAA